MALTINKVFQGFLRKLRSGGSEGTLLRGAGGLLFLNPVGLGLSFLSSIILTRLMGTTQFGIYTLVLTWVQMLILFTMTGLDTAFVRFVPNYLSKRAFAPLRGLLQ
jgi:O-antigen/teichoic acid export membrane protein